MFQLQQVLKDAGLDKREDLHTSAADLDEDTRRSIVQLVGEVCGKMLRAARAEGGRGCVSLAHKVPLRMQLNTRSRGTCPCCQLLRTLLWQLLCAASSSRVAGHVG